MRPRIPPFGESIHLRYHLVAYLDLLGQRERMAVVASTPADAGRDELLRRLKEMATPTVRFRTSFEELLDRFAEERPVPETVDPADRERFKAAKSAPIKLRGFADSLIITVPLSDDADHGGLPALTGVLRCIHGIAGISVLALQHGFVFRGGIAVAVGIDLYEDYYGPGLGTAYDLESQRAVWPRILIDDSVVEFLNAQRHHRDAKVRAFSDSLATNCRAMFYEDRDDGIRCLDFLGTEVARVGSVEPTDVHAVHAQAVQLLEDFRAQRNSKLVFKYERLVAYIESRLEVWRPT